MLGGAAVLGEQDDQLSISSLVPLASGRISHLVAPSFLNELPGLACDGSLESGLLLARLLQVVAICSPFPDQAVRVRREGRVLDSLP
jgi:hypothetical protein